MQLSTSTNICAFQRGNTKNDLPFCIEQCAKGGYTLLDINLCEAMNPSSRLRTDDWEAYIREIAQLAERLGVTFHQSHLPYYDIFSETDSDKIALMEELIRRSIQASGMLGVKWAVTHPGTVYSAGHNVLASLEANLNYYGKHLRTAEQAGIGIALENDFEYSGARRQRIFASSVEELCELADLFDSPHIGVCYDFGHANLCGGFHRQNLITIGRRLKAVHVQDNHGQHDEHLMPFFGSIDWADAMAGLAQCGYEGELTYEIQEFGRNLPNELKRSTIEQSIEIGSYLIELYNKARTQQ